MHSATSLGEAAKGLGLLLLAIAGSRLIIDCCPSASSMHGKQQHHQLRLLRQALLPS
jgi:hypothetical protein